MMKYKINFYLLFGKYKKCNKNEHDDDHDHDHDDGGGGSDGGKYTIVMDCCIVVFCL